MKNVKFRGLPREKTKSVEIPRFKFHGSNSARNPNSAARLEIPRDAETVGPTNKLKKIPFSRQKFLMTLFFFFSHRPAFSDYCHIRSFLPRKTTISEKNPLIRPFL